MTNEQTLILYYYNDGLTDGERRDVAVALGEDADLAARYIVLRRRLEQWRTPEEQQAPSHLAQRWHDSVAQAARAEGARAPKARTSLHFFSFAWGAVVTAALALGIGITAYFSGTTTFDPPAEELMANQTSVVPASFSRGLQLHLQQSQWELSRLPAEAAADRAFLVTQIIEQNRMFEQAAKLNNAPGLARVLRAFEPILMHLADEEIAPEDAEALRAQLSFELNVMLTKLARDPSNEARSI